MKPLRILIVDDYEVVREGIRSLLQDHADWTICGEASDGRDATAQAVQTKPDIVIMDIGMPNLNGLDAARQIMRDLPGTMILFLTMDESDHVMRQALSMGARGFLLKSDAGRDLVTAVEALQNQRTFFTSTATAMLLDGYSKRNLNSSTASDDKERLTAREREIVQLLAEGKSTKEVSTILGVSVKTAETHRSNIMRKLGFHSITEIVLYAVRNGLIQIAPSCTHAAIQSNVASHPIMGD